MPLLRRKNEPRHTIPILDNEYSRREIHETRASIFSDFVPFANFALGETADASSLARTSTPPSSRRKSSGDKRRTTRAAQVYYTRGGTRRGVAPFVQQYIIPASVLRRIVQVGWPLPSGGYCAPPIRGHTSRDTAAAICIRQRRALRIDVKICSKISLGNCQALLPGSPSFVVPFGATDVLALSRTGRL